MTQYKPRSAITGKFVKEYVLKKHPNTTYLDKIDYAKNKSRR